MRETLDKIKGIKSEPKMWTMRMLEALVNGVKGGKWFSVIDKVHSSETLRLAWEAVSRNARPAGVDKISVNKFKREGTSTSTKLRRS